MIILSIAAHKEKLELLLEQMWPRLYRFFYYKLQNKEEAEEMTQETFHRVYKKLDAGSMEEENMEGYVFTAARNLLTDLWRKKGRRCGTVSVNELQERGWDVAQQPQEIENALMVQQALSQLSPDYRGVLTWRIIEGRAVEEVARKMKRSPGAVRSLQHRAVAALREELEKGGFFDEPE